MESLTGPNSNALVAGKGGEVLEQRLKWLEALSSLTLTYFIILPINLAILVHTYQGSAWSTSLF